MCDVTLQFRPFCYQGSEFAIKFSKHKQFCNTVSQPGVFFELFPQCETERCVSCFFVEFVGGVLENAVEFEGASVLQGVETWGR